jgi:hypothetical protein
VTDRIFIMAILSRTYASFNILQEEPIPTPSPITTTLILRESSPLSPTQACYPGKLKQAKHKSGDSILFRKTLTSYLKKTRQGRELLGRIRERRTIPQVRSLLKLVGTRFLMIQFTVVKGCCLEGLIILVNRVEKIHSFLCSHIVLPFVTYVCIFILPVPFRSLLRVQNTK